MIIITIIRITGLTQDGKIDYVWEIYLSILAAEIGLTLVALTAFRALYISKTKSRYIQNPITTFNWYKKGRDTVLQVTSKVTGKLHPDLNSIEIDKGDEGFIRNDIPHGTMTGMKSYIEKNGKSVL